MAVGDASLARDPLSGEGIACALRSGSSGAEAVLRSLRGDDESLRVFAGRHRHAVRQYLVERTAAYSEQPRWSNCPFWQRRRLQEQQARGAGAELDLVA